MVCGIYPVIVDPHVPWVSDLDSDGRGARRVGCCFPHAAVGAHLDGDHVCRVEEWKKEEQADEETHVMHVIR